MDYVSVEAAKAAGGLRLVLTGGLPAPWSEAAKGLFKLRGVDYVPVLQEGGGANEEIVAWTGHRNAPTALYNDEASRVTPLDMVNLAERLGSGPSLFPEDMELRIRMTGLLNELAGENGFAWSARVLMFKSLQEMIGEEAMAANPMVKDYHFDPADAEGALARISAILDALVAQLRAQEAAGSRYLIGDRVTALDVYWACFSQMLNPLPPEVNPMPDFMRSTWGQVAQALEAGGYPVDPILYRHRDYLFENYLTLPLDF